MLTQLKCSHCKNLKDFKCFPLNSKKNNGFDSWCKECRKQSKCTRCSTIDGFLNDMGRWRKGCRYQRKFDIQYELTFEQKKELWDKQKGLCALTGLPMTHSRGNGRIQTNASIDRIDSSVGYEIFNVQLVMWCANRAKGEMQINEFVAMCKAIVKNQNRQ